MKRKKKGAEKICPRSLDEPVWDRPAELRAQRALPSSLPRGTAARAHAVTLRLRKGDPAGTAPASARRVCLQGLTFGLPAAVHVRTALTTKLPEGVAGASFHLRNPNAKINLKNTSMESTDKFPLKPNGFSTAA